MASSFCVFSRLSKILFGSVSLSLLISTAAWAGYDEDIAPIIKANCNSCHAKQAPKLETYDDVVKAVTKIVASITIDPNGPEKDKLMPKGKKLDTKDIEKIKSWQSAGTPKTGAGGKKPEISGETGPTDPNIPNANNVPDATGPSDNDTNNDASNDAGTQPGGNVPGPGTDSSNPTPLIIDLSEKGDFTYAKKRVSFNIHGDQILNLSWPSANAAFLALDLNNNGVIDSGKELFGDGTVLQNQNKKRAEHGFAALSQYDLNKDKIIDVDDPIFSKIIVWHDKNENGISESHELTFAYKDGITSFGLMFTKVSRQSPTGKTLPLYISEYSRNGTKRILADIFLDILSAK
jgi:hypothetical protein